jgi:hypothetical protein
VKEELIGSDDVSVFTISLVEATGVPEARIEKDSINVVKARLSLVQRVKVNFQQACSSLS